jgi:hypothetical protein
MCETRNCGWRPSAPESPWINYDPTGFEQPCFVAGTQVVVPPDVPAGDSAESPPRPVTRSIDALRPGDMVLAKSDVTGEVGWKRVLRTFRTTADHLRVLAIRPAGSTASQVIRTTNEHPFWVVGYGWMAAGGLAPGCRLVQSDGRAATVTGTLYEPHPDGVAVYNFSVEDDATYFVSQDGTAAAVWVHNNCEGPRARLQFARQLDAEVRAIRDAALPIVADEQGVTFARRQVAGGAASPVGGSRIVAFSSEELDAVYRSGRVPLPTGWELGPAPEFDAGGLARNSHVEIPTARYVRREVGPGVVIYVATTSPACLKYCYPRFIAGQLPDIVHTNLYRGYLKDAASSLGLRDVGTVIGSGQDDLSLSGMEGSATNPGTALTVWSGLLSGPTSPQISVCFQHLGGGELGESRIDAVGPDGLPTAGTILISPNAAGVGWFVDPTPLDNSEFGTWFGPDAFQAFGDSPAAGKYDLLTVLLHEEAHLLGSVRPCPASRRTSAPSPARRCSSAPISRRSSPRRPTTTTWTATPTPTT